MVAIYPSVLFFEQWLWYLKKTGKNQSCHTVNVSCCRSFTFLQNNKHVWVQKGSYQDGLRLALNILNVIYETFMNSGQVKVTELTASF
jgi:hypothetical protein